jgi:hypothetical protein
MADCDDDNDHYDCDDDGDNDSNSDMNDRIDGIVCLSVGSLPPATGDPGRSSPVNIKRDRIGK